MDEDKMRVTKDSMGRDQLLGLVAMAQLWMLEACADASRHAVELPDRVALCDQLSVHSARFETLREALADALIERMAPFRSGIEAFGKHTEPHTLGESLVRLDLCRNLARGLWEAACEHVDAHTRTMVEGAGDDERWTETRVQQLLAQDSQQRDRLALHGRRIFGEATSQAQSMWARNPELTALVTGAAGDADDDLEVISTMMAQLASGHDRRMAELGLL